MICQVRSAICGALNGVKTVLVGVSGGADSVCLLHALCASGKENATEHGLKNSGLKIIGVHLNHGWRGVQSDDDENFVHEFCAKLGVEFYSERLKDNCEKTETAAREARYEFFERAMTKFGADTIFLAHNKNDNVETLVYRLVKGTGIEGLKSIPMQRELGHGKIVRPLLGVERSEIEKYLAQHNLEYREDASNTDTHHARNLIRHEILPLFAKINPNYLNNVENLIEVANNECGLSALAVAKAREYVFEGAKMCTEKFLEQPDPIKLKLIYNYLKDDLKFYDLVRIKRIVDFIEVHATQTQDPQFRPHKRFSINSKLFLYVNKKEIFKDERH